MGNYEQLKAAIADVIKTNGNQEITGQILQNTLLSIINSVGANAAFAGIATPETNPGTPDQNVFYIASENGTYSNFDGTNNQFGNIYIFINPDGQWQGIKVSVSNSQRTGDTENSAAYALHRLITNGMYVDKLGANNVDGYLNSSGKIIQLSNSKTSDFVPVIANAQYQIYSLLLELAAIVFYDAEKTRISSILPNDGWNNRTITTPANCAYLRYCTLSTTDIENQGVKYIGSDAYIDPEYNDLLALETPISDLEIIVNGLSTPIEYTTTSGQYIATNGALVPLSFGHISNPIAVSQGDIVFFIAKANSNVAMISKTDASGSSYTPVVIGTGGTQEAIRQTAEYLVTEDGYVAFSLIGSDAGIAYKVGRDGILGQLADLETSGASTINILAAFDNVVCVGDSLTYSQVYTGTSASRQAKRTYPQVLAKLCGNEQMTLARAGATARSCWNEFGSQVTAKTNPLAIIYLGTNYGITDTLDTDVVGEDPDNWADNNVGCYCRFVQKFQSLGYKVLLLRIWATSGTGDSDLTHTNSAISHIATRFGCAVMDVPTTAALEYHYYPDLSGYNSVHYNDLGYSWFATKIIEKTGLLPVDQMKLIIPNA